MSHEVVDVVEQPVIVVEVAEAVGARGPKGDPGRDGVDGLDGAPGKDGAPGRDGTDGLSAYEVAVAAGFVGTEVEWLASLVGPAGADGKDGRDGVDGAPGPAGERGPEGPQGPAGEPGPQGDVGPAGEPGPQGERGLPGADGAQGPKGDPGPKGDKGDPGADGAPGVGVPTGGTVGQILTKTGTGDYDTGWADAAGDGGSGLDDVGVAALIDSPSSATRSALDALGTRRNLVPNPSFETGLAGVRTHVSLTLIQTAFAPAVRAGAYAAAVTVTGTPAVYSYVCQDVTVSEGQWLAATIPARASGSSQRVTPRIDFFNGSTFLSGTMGTRIDAPAGVYVTPTHVAQAPAGTTLARVYLYMHSTTTDAPLVGATLQTDAWIACAASTQAAALAQVQTYFDGDTPSEPGRYITWDGTPHASSSTERTGAFAAYAAMVAPPPGYAGGGRTRRWAAPVYNPDAADLAKISGLIAAGQFAARDVHLVALGDSKTEGTGAVAGQRPVQSWAGVLRRMLGAVEGFIAATDPASDARWTLTGLIRSTDPLRNGILRAGGATDVTATFVHDVDHTGGTFLVHCAAGGTVSIAVDGGTAQPFTIAAGDGYKAVTPTVTGNGAHTYVITSSDNVRMFGFVPTFDGPRLRLSNVGRTGSTAAGWLAGAVSDGTGLWETFRAAVPNPDAIIAQIGTNSPATSAGPIGQLWDAITALGTPALVITPGGLGGAAAFSTYTGIYAAAFDAADEYGLPLLDFQSVIGDYATADAAGLMTNSLHENRIGYAYEAAALRALLT